MYIISVYIFYYMSDFWDIPGFEIVVSSYPGNGLTAFPIWRADPDWIDANARLNVNVALSRSGL